MSELQKQIKKTMEQVRQRERVRKHLFDLEKRLTHAYKEQDKLAAVLEKEYEDVERLEKLSLKSMFHKILGSKEEQMDQERQDYLQASLKYDEHKKTIDLLEYEQKVLNEKLVKQKDLEADLAKMLQRRERELVRGDSKSGRKLLKIQKKMEQHQMMLVEVKEAIHVGQEALEVLDKMVLFLRKARNWGHWGKRRQNRGMAFHKHSNIDRAREQAIYAQQLLHRFDVELRDVYQNVERFQLHLQLDSFGRFIDVFFDNLISDWIVQQKIQHALSNVRAVRDRLLRMLEGLRNEEVHGKTEVKRLQRQRRRALEK